MEDAKATARSAIDELRRLIATDTLEVSVEEVMRLADQAVFAFDLEKDRKEIADMLLEPLTVLRFATVFGNDAAAARQRANGILDAIVKATLPTA